MMWLEVIFYKILEMSLMASIVILGVLLVRQAFKRLPKVFSYILWSVVLFRLLCPVSPTSTFSFFELLQLPVQEMGIEQSRVQESAGERTQNGMQDSLIHDTSIDIANQEKEVNIPAFSSLQMQGAQKDIAHNRKLLFLDIWLLGVAVLTGYGVISLVSLKKKLVGAVRQEGHIFQSDYITIPFVMGGLQPSIYLPSSLNLEEKEYIILHEQIHIRRGDHVFRVLAFLALTLHWFNPLVWLAFILSGMDMEMSCDEAVMKKSRADIRAVYSESLLNLASGRPRLGGVWTSFEGGNVKNRVQNVMKYKKPTQAVLVLAVLVVFALVFTMGCNPGKDSEKVAEQDSIEAQTDETQADKAEEEPTDEAEEEPTDEAVEEPADEQNETAETASWAKTWAQAFCGRDGKTIYDMSGEAVRKQLEEEMLLDGNSFGWSSPWPWVFTEGVDNYTIVEETALGAVILYYAMVSDPHVTVWRETLTVHSSATDKNVTVDGEQLTYMEDIDTYEKYMQAYPNGITGTPMDYVTNGAGESIRQQTETAEVSNDYFAQFFLPETAAVTQLNLSKDSEKVQVEAGEPEEDGSMPLKITFKESGDVVSLHMIQPYGENGIWVVK